MFCTIILNVFLFSVRGRIEKDVCMLYVSNKPERITVIGHCNFGVVVVAFTF